MWRWITLFIISFSVNIVFLLYVRWLLNNFRALGEEIEIIKELTTGFSTHLKSLYELEMFYGDSTLKELLEQGQQLIEELEEVDYILNQDEEEELEIEQNLDQINPT